MAPKPLSSLDQKCEIIFDKTATEIHTGLATCISAIFSKWAYIEFGLGGLLIELLASNASPTVAMFYETRNASAQIKLIEIAAAHQLTEENHKLLFSAVMSLTKSALKKRNKIAHSVWGRSKEHPDHLLLISPSELIKNHAEMADEFNRAFSRKSERQSKIGYDREKIFVYAKQDLEEIVDEMAGVAGHIASLCIAIKAPPAHFGEFDITKEISARLAKGAKQVEADLLNNREIKLAISQLQKRKT